MKESLKMQGSRAVLYGYKTTDPIVFLQICTLNSLVCIT